MGLGFGLELGQVKPEDLAKARQMVPRALEQYVTQLAEKGPGANTGMPRVTTPVKLEVNAKQEPQQQQAAGGDEYVVLGGGAGAGGTEGIMLGESPNSSDVDIS